MQENRLETMCNVTKAVVEEMSKVIIGKDDVIRKVLMSVIAGGHILLDDVPGVGKTTLAVALGKTFGMKYNRIQFTPDVLPSDIVGFSIYNKDREDFVYKPGIINNTNLLLADEINRTSSRTQAALLEAMEEKQVTVDGIAHNLPNPFIVIATQNQVGAAGTQILPHAQLDRFLVKLALGYPDKENEKEIIKGRQTLNPYADIKSVVTADAITELQNACLEVGMKDEIVTYITDLVIASRKNPNVELGISPRGGIAVSHMAKSCALMAGRDYVTEEDVREVFADVCSHRIILTQKARAAHVTQLEIINGILSSVKTPFAV